MAKIGEKTIELEPIKAFKPINTAILLKFVSGN
jgi:hypothetical protein